MHRTEEPISQRQFKESLKNKNNFENNRLTRLRWTTIDDEKLYFAVVDALAQQATVFCFKQIISAQSDTQNILPALSGGWVRTLVLMILALQPVATQSNMY